MNNLSTFQKLNIYLGLIFIFSSVLPISSVLQATVGGMYGAIFRKYSPALYHLVNLFVSYSITALIIYFGFKKLDVIRRIKGKYASTTLFAVGNFVLVLYLVVRIFASTIQGGGPSLAVSMIGVYPVTIAKIILSVAIVRVLISVEPWPEPEAARTPGRA